LLEADLQDSKMGRGTRDLDPLLAGFFTLRDSARLLQIDNVAKIRGWLDGWSNSDSKPVIERDFEGGVVSFLDLIEIRFVNHFRRQGVTMQTIRRAIRELRREWGVRHPLALRNGAKYHTDRRKIFARAAESEGDERTWDIATHQYEMWMAMEEAVARYVAFDPATQLARSWRPLGLECPNVLVDPRFAFGQPVIGARPTPTAVLFKQWKAQGENSEFVSRWFDLQTAEVEEAVRFESSLPT
jgi:uncharacterized protein (DUF433 family)